MLLISAHPIHVWRYADTCDDVLVPLKHTNHLPRFRVPNSYGPMSDRRQTDQNYCHLLKRADQLLNMVMHLHDLYDTVPEATYLSALPLVNLEPSEKKLTQLKTDDGPSSNAS